MDIALGFYPGVSQLLSRWREPSGERPTFCPYASLSGRIDHSLQNENKKVQWEYDGNIKRTEQRRK